MYVLCSLRCDCVDTTFARSCLILYFISRVCASGFLYRGMRCCSSMVFYSDCIFILVEFVVDAEVRNCAKLVCRQKHKINIKRAIALVCPGCDALVSLINIKKNKVALIQKLSITEAAIHINQVQNTSTKTQKQTNLGISLCHCGGDLLFGCPPQSFP